MGLGGLEGGGKGLVAVVCEASNPRGWMLMLVFVVLPPLAFRAFVFRFSSSSSSGSDLVGGRKMMMEDPCASSDFRNEWPEFLDKCSSSNSSHPSPS